MRPLPAIAAVFTFTGVVATVWSAQLDRPLVDDRGRTIVVVNINPQLRGIGADLLGGERLPLPPRLLPAQQQFQDPRVNRHRPVLHSRLFPPANPSRGGRSGAARTASSSTAKKKRGSR